MKRVVVALAVASIAALVPASSPAEDHECAVRDQVAVLVGMPDDAERTCSFEAASDTLYWGAAVASDWFVVLVHADDTEETVAFQSNAGARYPSQAGREAGSIAVTPGMTIKLGVSGGCTVGCASYGALVAGPAVAP